MYAPGLHVNCENMLVVIGAAAPILIVAEEHLLLLLCKLKYACKDSKEKCHCLIFDVNKETLQNDKSTQKLKSTMLLQHCMRAVQFIMLTHDYM